ncbi:hypothetical protein Ab1vBOLIVR2_gp12 [Agrobacterium phage OLIVR2]|uniref:Uncharacterized protein n=1 Tax=Agrobacterium phage OLIVR1 TaxID=2723769 RepID=A0A858MQZ9_9CAUD|nr:hypothetical protein KNU98_gp097 [Agrobacterium phage OLIVR1]QIW87207.1 hypothetical protein Ab1vBOLIVR1_gp12 [Agrobacterium phage OLIVR1]QIW87315.1 hypothetical protein Ab1vBOLIVR2_gp12 [Agrobacterium phage OLIVR2]
MDRTYRLNQRNKLLPERSEGKITSTNINSSMNNG